MINTANSSPRAMPWAPHQCRRIDPVAVANAEARVAAMQEMVDEFPENENVQQHLTAALEALAAAQGTTVSAEFVR